ncbi:cysteine desulfurase NifS [Clostridium sp. JN-9]|uniref:cysteine desulfurase NifS n=1 Tax=Clostridium sp. JN-9 TaxID=2507159 RepID=UPI000FFE2D35|nr:cysteine desulfurase NifS [Clostridium sp. JN-9]QAT41100.1 cysteine desulfurase NifS [Clostridium sp. JN-9]
MEDIIYMDYAATTYLKKEVLDEMYPYLTKYFGNPSSIYSISRKTKRAIDISRERIANAINCRMDEVFFTAGGSESDNWAIKGAALANKEKGNHIITSAIEHHAVINTCKYLEKNGFQVDYVPVGRDGKIDVDLLKSKIKKNTIMVSVMTANNEIGTIEPIKEIGDICKDKGIIFHTDAVQAIGALPIDVNAMNVDMLSMSAHKFYGPKGVGALYIRKGTKIHNLIHGGAQERGKRSGTENISGIVGMGKAIEMAVNNMNMETERLKKLRDKLIKGLLEIDDTILNGTAGNSRLPGNVNVCFKNVEGQLLLMMLDRDGICASSGSACSAGSLEPSHVLKAIGVPLEYLKGSVRFTLGAGSNEKEVEYVIEHVKNIVNRLRNHNN